jgi:5-methylcytosine-specific restriction endonuclease McrA
MKKSEKIRNGKQWTEARFRSFIISALRAASRKWGQKYAALDVAFTQRKTNKKTGLLAKHFQCASCHNEFIATDIQVDHIQPVVNPKTGFTTWDDYINRMFCEVDGYQVLCKPCHKTKTDQEKSERKKP